MLDQSCPCESLSLARRTSRPHGSHLIFFHARKRQERNRPKSLLVWVESAQAEQDNIRHPMGKGTRTFAAMLGEHWQN